MDQTAGQPVFGQLGQPLDWELISVGQHQATASAVKG
jgi:hypothetical protein